MKKYQVNKKSMLFLLGLLLISCLFIFKNFLFGNQVLAYCAPDIGSDTYDQYLLHYQAIINHIRDGNFSLWDFSNGYGANMFNYNLFNPFLVLIYLFGVLLGAEQIYGFLVYWIILHILLAGIAIYLFMSCFSLSENAKVIAAYIYALSGYMVVWGQHYQFGSVMIFFPLMLLMVERSFCRKRGYLGITVMCAFAALSSLYMSYMQFIVLGFYILFRVAWKENIFSKQGITRICKLYGSMILGIGIGFINLLPSAYVILNVSNRVSNGSFIERMIGMISLYPSHYYEVLVKRMFSSNILGVNDYAGYYNYYEDPNIFLSVLLIIALGQFIYYFLKDTYTKKQKVILVIAGLLLAFAILIPLGGAVFNAFAYPIFRHTFLYMSFGTWMIAFILDKVFVKKDCSMILLILSVVGVCAAYMMIFKGTGYSVPLLLGILAMGMGISIGGYVLVRNAKIEKLCVCVLLASVVFTMSGDALLSFDTYRVTLEKSESDYMENLYDEDVEAAIEYINSIDTSFYRIEKDYTVGTDVSCLNSMAQGYRGISTYNSTMNTNIVNMLNIIWPNTMVVNTSHYSFANSSTEDLPASLSHVKYVLSKSDTYATPGYVLLEQFGDIYVYQNTNTEDLGKFYTTTISSEVFAEAIATGKQYDVLTDYLICDTAVGYQKSLEELPVEAKVWVGGPDQVALSVSEESVISLNLSNLVKNGGKKLILEFDISHVAGNNYVSILSGGSKTFFNVQPTPIRLSFTVPEKDIPFNIHLSSGMNVDDVLINNIAVFEVDKTDLSHLSDGITFENTTNDSLITGTTNVPESGMLMVAIPYEDGWNAYVDGEKVDIHKVNYGFCGIELAEGKHEVEFRYECPWFTAGCVGSTVFIILTLSIWLIFPIYKKNIIKIT